MPQNNKLTWKEVPDFDRGIQSPDGTYVSQNIVPLSFMGVSKPVTPAGISNELLMRQQYKESLFNPKATSESEAKGLAQLRKNVVDDAVKAGIIKKGADLYNPDTNIKVQKWYMNNLYNSSFINKPGQDEGVRQAKTLAAYNWGRGNLLDYLNSQKSKGVDIYNSYDWVNNLPKETKDYVNKIGLKTDPKFESDYSEAAKNYQYKFADGGGTNLPAFTGVLPNVQLGRQEIPVSVPEFKVPQNWKPTSKMSNKQALRYTLKHPEEHPLATGRADYLPVESALIPAARFASPIANYAVDMMTGAPGVRELASNAISNVYKLNPWAFKPNPEAYYRMIGNEGFADAMESGVIRANPKLKQFDDVYFSMKHPWDGRNYGYVTRSGEPIGGVGYKGPYMVELTGQELNHPISSFPRANMAQSNIPISIQNPGVKFYKQDWLRGYKPVEVPKTSAITNATSNIPQEIIDKDAEEINRLLRKNVSYPIKPSTAPLPAERWPYSRTYPTIEKGDQMHMDLYSDPQAAWKWYNKTYHGIDYDKPIPTFYDPYTEELSKKKFKDGGLIKRADGSYSRRGLWDNIRANRGSGKEPTPEMLKQEKKIKAKYADGGQIKWSIIK